jgi:hypothetical protein
MMHLQAEDTEYVLTTTAEKYIMVKQADDTPSSRNTKWKKDDAKTRYTITIYIDDFDQEATTDLTSAREIWEFLKRKYKDIRPVVGNQCLTQLTNYQVKEGTSIMEAWTELGKIRRQLKETRPTITTAFDEAELFQRPIAGLPESYSTIRDGMETLTNTSISERLQMLQDKEDRLKGEIALTGKLCRNRHGGKARNTSKLTIINVGEQPLDASNKNEQVDINIKTDQNHLAHRMLSMRRQASGFKLSIPTTGSKIG